MVSKAMAGCAKDEVSTWPRNWGNRSCMDASPQIENERKRIYGQFSIETIHERRKRNREFSAYSNRKTKCQNYSKISRN